MQLLQAGHRFWGAPAEWVFWGWPQFVSFFEHTRTTSTRLSWLSYCLSPSTCQGPEVRHLGTCSSTFSIASQSISKCRDAKVYIEAFTKSVEFWQVAWAFVSPSPETKAQSNNGEVTVFKQPDLLSDFTWSMHGSCMFQIQITWRLNLHDCYQLRSRDLTQDTHLQLSKLGL